MFLKAKTCKAKGMIAVVEGKYRSLFENMMDGFAYHKIIFDTEGNPVDYVFLEVNKAFELLTGLKRAEVIGRKVTEVLPGIEQDSVNWISEYGRVAITGLPIRFENYSKNLNRWYSISAYSPEKGYFAAVFEDITSRKELEAWLLASENKYRRL
jgi:PAS domain S-box-containing protein